VTRDCKSQASRLLKKQETLKPGSFGYIACMCFDNNCTGYHLLQNDPFAILSF